MLKVSASVIRIAENRARDEARKRMRWVNFEGVDDDNIIVID